MQHVNPLLSAGVKLLELLFVVGILGSAVVIILTAVEDVRTMFSKDTKQELRKDEWPRQL